MKFAKLTLLVIPIFLVTACGTETRIGNLQEYCNQTEPLWFDHVEALIEDGGPKSVVTGDKLVTVRDSVCDGI